jgi:hypothetical protein
MAALVAWGILSLFTGRPRASERVARSRRVALATRRPLATRRLCLPAVILSGFRASPHYFY